MIDRLGITTPRRQTQTLAMTCPRTVPSASGKAAAIYDTETKALNCTVTYAGLTGPPLDEYGPGEAGKNAGVALPLNLPKTDPCNATLTHA
jgi:hypothetical protein